MKFHGTIGFWFNDAEVEPGRFLPHVEERPGYHGDVLRNNLRTQSVSDQQNDNLVINNRLSILSDLYLQQNWSSIRYVIWNGVRWKVTNVELNYPRIILEVGGIYNGPTTLGEAEGDHDGSNGDS